MFYAHFVLAKKGPLARIWLAAHWDKKLTKAHVFETNIESSVEGILQPKVKMALRTSGHLLLGIVRIYSRKAKYLLADCNEAFIKIKMAFRPGVVDLPEGNREAAVATITLPEVFHDFDSAMPDITIDMDAQVTLNQSRAEDITLKEDYGLLSLTDDGFGDMAFDDPEVARDATNIDEGFDHASLLLCEDQNKERGPDENIQSTSDAAGKSSVELDPTLKDDAFEASVGEGLLDGESGNLFEPAGLFDDAPLGHVPLENSSTEQNVENLDQGTEKRIEPREEEDSDDDMYDMGPASMGAPSPPSSPESPGLPMINDAPGESETMQRNANSLDMGDAGMLGGADPAAEIMSTVPNEMPPPPVPPLPPLDHGNYMTNEDESFALAPLDATVVHGAERTVKAKRKRKLIVDEIKNISGEEMKSQLSDATDIITTLDLAPPTKRLMHWKETGGVEKLFALPGHPILSKLLSRSYQRHLCTRSVENEDFGVEEDNIDLDATELEQARDDTEVVGSARKKRREMDPVMPEDLSHLDSLHLEPSRSSYPTDHNLPHTSLEVSSFLQSQHHMFSPMTAQQMAETQQMMPPVMPPVMPHPPPAHMIHQMLESDLNQLSHLPQMMHPSMVDQAPPLHGLGPNMHDGPSPIVSEAYAHHSVIEPVSQHLLSDPLPQMPPMPEHMQQPAVDKHIPSHSPLDEQLHQPLQDHLPQEHVPCIENNSLRACVDGSVPPPCIDGQLPSAVDDDVTQPCLEHYDPSHVDGSSTSLTNACGMPNALPHSDPVDEQLPQPSEKNAELDNDALNQQVSQNHIDPAMSLFESLNNGEINTEKNNQENNENLLQKNQEFPLSDDEDDYGAPSSVGPLLPEEQMADETYEQFEERILTKRTTHMLHIIHHRLDNDRSVNFSEVVRNNQRKQVAQKFYTFLVLKKQQAVELEQDTSYGELVITRGPKFSAVYNG